MCLFGTAGHHLRPKTILLWRGIKGEGKPYSTRLARREDSGEEKEALQEKRE